MEMISRNELYLKKILGEEVELPASPLSRIETYLAYLAGEDVELPEAISSRNEAYLAKCCGIDTELPPAPLSETELYLAYLAGEDVELPEAPSTRINTLLATIIANGGFEPEEEEDSYLFRQLMNMEDITFTDPYGQKTLGDFAFSYDTILEEVIFPEATMISTSCFEYASALKKAVFPEATRCSNSRSFMGCNKLEELRLPKCTSGLNNILSSSTLDNLRILDTKTTAWNFNVSSGGKKLELVILRGTSLVSGTPAFNAQCPIAQGTGRILVHPDLVEEYKSAAGWSAYADCIYAIPEDE